MDLDPNFKARGHRPPGECDDQPETDPEETAAPKQGEGRVSSSSPRVSSFLSGNAYMDTMLEGLADEGWVERMRS